MNKKHCWIVGIDADTNEIRPSRVTKKDAKEVGVTMYNSYEECLKHCHWSDEIVEVKSAESCQK